MNISVPQNFQEVTKAQFDAAIASANLLRDAYWDGVLYIAIGHGTEVTYLLNASGAKFVHPVSKNVAIALDSGRFFIDPEFFK